MDNVQKAADTNIEAVSLLVSGEELKALQTFNEALSLMQHAACELHASRNTRSSNALLQQPIVQESLNYNCMTVDILSTTTDQPTIEEQFHIYNCAFIFDIKNFSATSPSACLDICFYSTIIVFNLALCKHLMSRRNNISSKTAEECNPKHSSLLNEALQLYAACSNFMKGFRFHTNDTFMLLAGALNNEAQIHHECFSNFEEASVLFKQLSKLVGSIESNLPSLGEKRQHVEHFALNTFTADKCSRFAPSA